MDEEANQPVQATQSITDPAGVGAGAGFGFDDDFFRGAAVGNDRRRQAEVEVRRAWSARFSGVSDVQQKEAFQQESRDAALRQAGIPEATVRATPFGTSTGP